MASYKKSKYKKLLALCMSVMMASTMAAFVACDDGKSSNDDTTEDTTDTEVVEKDESTILNGSFEYNSKKEKTPIITSTSGWSRTTDSVASGSAGSSNAVSGIVDTADEAWANLTKSKIQSVLGKAPEELTVSEAKANWTNGNMSAYDKIKFMDAYEDDTDEDPEKLDFFDSEKDPDPDSYQADDLPYFSDENYNPGTHYASTDANAAKNTNVLMIHNDATESRGTAQKYTSSTTITLQPNTSAEVSLWVKTADLAVSSLNGEAQVAGDGVGAYVAITHTVGGKTLDKFELKNINTSGVTSNNGWVEYTFWIEGSSFVDSTFTMVLGLGHGSTSDRFEYVNGYAFFDDVTCTVYPDTEENKDKANDAVPTNNWKNFSDEGDKKVFRADKEMKGETTFGLSLKSNSDWVGFDTPFSIGVTEEQKGKVTYVSAVDKDDPDYEKKTVYGQLGFNIGQDKRALYDNFSKIGEDVGDNQYLSAVYNSTFAPIETEGETEKTPRKFANEKTLLLMSVNGAAWTAKLESEKFTLAAGEKMAISFFVKTSDFEGATGAGITLVDGDSKTSISAIDTTTITTVDIGDEKDVYDGWQRCLFYVTNDTEDTVEKTFTLEFTVGSTTVYGTSKKDYHPGFAAFTNFEIIEQMSDEEYKCVSAGTYAKTVSLLAEDEEELGDAGFDSTAYIPTDLIETNIAAPKNYTGGQGANGAVIFGGEDIVKNEYAGLINSKYIDNYLEEAANDTENKYWLNKMGITTKAQLEALFGDTKSPIAATQPLLIYNESKKSYGFYGATQTLAASTYTAISVRVKVSAGATAYVYLVDMSEEGNKSVMTIDRKVSYWYNDDGNVCEEDPSENTKKSNVAFKLQANGLYKVNKDWTKAANYDKNVYYANLANYEVDPVTKNLLVADGGVSYNYNDNYKNDGNDGIAFYYKDGKYYANSKCEAKDEVRDFAEANGGASALNPRYEENSAEKLEVKIEGSEGSAAYWQTVTFFVATGSESKSYRLEVWSGERNSKADNVTQGEYVLFDSNDFGTFENFDDLLDTREQQTNDYFKDGYSFYDDARFLRYDETLDKNDGKNAYESYVTKDYNAEGFAYLYYEDSVNKELYVSYALSEVTVTADIETDNDTTTGDEKKETTETNVFLLASSLVLAAVLVLAVISLIVRKLILKKIGRKVRVPKEKKAKRVKKAKPAKAKKPEARSENDPYND